MMAPAAQGAARLAPLDPARDTRVLDISASQVVEKLEDHLSRFPVRSDLVVLVDMGGLKDIGRCLSESLKVSVGVLNGVSTPMALRRFAAKRSSPKMSH